jgi:hypothetical protein
MTNKSGLGPDDLVRNRVTEDEDEDLSVEGHSFKVGRASGEPGPEDVHPKATEDDHDVEADGIRAR